MLLDLLIDHATSNACASSSKSWCVAVGVTSGVNNQGTVFKVVCGEARCNDSRLRFSIFINNKFAEIASMSIPKGS
jgi:hypothetical protein